MATVRAMLSESKKAVERSRLQMLDSVLAGIQRVQQSMEKARTERDAEDRRNAIANQLVDETADALGSIGDLIRQQADQARSGKEPNWDPVQRGLLLVVTALQSAQAESGVYQSIDNARSP